MQSGMEAHLDLKVTRFKTRLKILLEISLLWVLHDEFENVVVCFLTSAIPSP